MGSSQSIPTPEEYQKALTFEKCSQRTFCYRISKFTRVCTSKNFTFKNDLARQAAVSFILIIFSDIIIDSDNSRVGPFIIQTINELQNPLISDYTIQSLLNTRLESEKVVWGLSNKSFDMTFKIFMNIPHIADYF
jgi:hypothetical protein